MFHIRWIRNVWNSHDNHQIHIYKYVQSQILFLSTMFRSPLWPSSVCLITKYSQYKVNCTKLMIKPVGIALTSAGFITSFCTIYSMLTVFCCKTPCNGHRSDRNIVFKNNIKWLNIFIYVQFVGYHVSKIQHTLPTGAVFVAVMTIIM